MGGVEQARVFVFPLLHKFGTRGKIWRNTHLVWVAVSCEIRKESRNWLAFTIYHEGVPIREWFKKKQNGNFQWHLS